MVARGAWPLRARALQADLYVSGCVGGCAWLLGVHNFKKLTRSISWVDVNMVYFKFNYNKATLNAIRLKSYWLRWSPARIQPNGAEWREMVSMFHEKEWACMRLVDGVVGRSGINGGLLLN